MKRKSNLVLFPLFLWFFSGLACQAKDKTVQAGKSIKTYTPSGIYSDVYVDPDYKDESLITLSSDVSGAIQVRSYFDGISLKKILIQGDQGGFILQFMTNEMGPDDILITMTEKKEGKTSVVKYKLVPVNEEN